LRKHCKTKAVVEYLVNSNCDLTQIITNETRIDSRQSTDETQSVTQTAQHF